MPEIVPLWLKNRNQRIHMGGLMRGCWCRCRCGSYIKGAYTWSHTSVKEKMCLSGGKYTQGRLYAEKYDIGS